jgi:hypothetical protein
MLTTLRMGLALAVMVKVPARHKVTRRTAEKLRIVRGVMAIAS